MACLAAPAGVSVRPGGGPIGWPGPAGVGMPIGESNDVPAAGGPVGRPEGPPGFGVGAKMADEATA
eukprot:7911560-Alexandrium_andersonii.AAC.1